MSEDCHDSNNDEFDFRIFDDPAILCAECGEPVFANEAYPLELEHRDGTFEVVVFHDDFAKSCPLKWSIKRLEAAGEKMKKILEIYDSIKESLKTP